MSKLTNNQYEQIMKSFTSAAKVLKSCESKLDSANQSFDKAMKDLTAMLSNEVSGEIAIAVTEAVLDKLTNNIDDDKGED